MFIRPELQIKEVPGGYQNKSGKILPRVPLPHNTTLISVTTLNC